MLSGSAVTLLLLTSRTVSWRRSAMDAGSFVSLFPAHSNDFNCDIRPTLSGSASNPFPVRTSDVRRGMARPKCLGSVSIRLLLRFNVSSRLQDVSKPFTDLSWFLVKLMEISLGRRERVHEPGTTFIGVHVTDSDSRQARCEAFRVKDAISSSLASSTSSWCTSASWRHVSPLSPVSRAQRTCLPPSWITWTATGEWEAATGLTGVDFRLSTAATTHM